MKNKQKRASNIVGRNIDMVKAMTEINLSRNMASNELNEEAHREVTGIEFHSRVAE